MQNSRILITIINNDIDNVLYLPIPDDGKKTYEFQDIINYQRDTWFYSEASCTKCANGTFLEKNEITRTSDILIIVLKLFELKNGNIIKINDLKIKAVPSSKIRIDNYNYKVLSTIFHIGNTIYHGHYKCMVREDNSKWTLIDDKDIKMSTSWPRNAKDAYIFILEKTK